MANTWMKAAVVAGLMACSAGAFASQRTISGDVVSDEQAAQMQAQAQKTIKAQKLNPSLAGSNWQLNYDWQCFGNPSIASVNVYGNHTFEVEGYTGTWTQNKKDVVFVFDLYPAVYTGKLTNSTHVTGTMMDNQSGLTGCWTADRL